MAIAALAAMIPSLIQAISGASQNSKANKYADENRPNMQIPQGMLDSVDISKNMALQTGLPRQDLIEEKLDESGANTLASVKEGATSPWDVIKGAQRIGEVKSEKVKDLGIAGAEYERESKNQYIDVLQQLSGLQERQYMMNDYAPYLASQDAAKNLRNSGAQNMFGGASNISGMIAEYPDMFKGLFSGIGAKGATNRLDNYTDTTMQSLKYVAQ